MNGRESISRCHRRGHRRHPGLPGPRRQGLQGPPCGEDSHHRGEDGPPGQDLPHHGLRHLHPRPQDDRGPTPPRHRAPHLLRGHRGHGNRGELHRQHTQEAPLRRRGEVHRLRPLRRQVPCQGPRRVPGGPRREEGDLPPLPPVRPPSLHHRRGALPLPTEGDMQGLREDLRVRRHRLRPER
jgi:hypothetical protein